MNTETFNRFEYKYPIDLNLYYKIIPIISEHMYLDKYNINGKPYTISNVYYDTIDNLLVRNSISKPLYKEKLRLRSYGVPENDVPVFIEIKKKFNGLVNKRRTSIILTDAYKFLDNKGFYKAEVNESQIQKEILYFLSRYEVSPKVYIAYDRYAYLDRNNSDLRISFDFNIRARRDNLRLEFGDYGSLISSPEQVIMEIKSAYSMPLWLTSILSSFGIKRQSFSKYGLEYKKFLKCASAERSLYA